MIQELSDRFDQLSEAMASIDRTERDNYDNSPEPYKSVDSALLLTWKVQVMHLLKSAYGEDSPHYIEFSKITESDSGVSGSGLGYYTFQSMKAIFIAAKNDYQGGGFGTSRGPSKG